MPTRPQINQPPAYLPWLFMALALLTLPAISQPAEPVEPVGDQSRYYRTIQSLHDSSSELQADFAITALRELVTVYIAEADLARNEAEQEGGNPKLLGWSRAVDRYASQLLLVLEDIDLGFPARLSQSREGATGVTVGGRAVILNHPRADQQAAFEQGVLLEFCTRNNCQLLTARSSAPVPIPLSSSQVKPDWNFTENGLVCSHAGIQLRFVARRNLPRSRSICVQVLQEAATLANEMAWQQRHGVTIDWSVLQIRATPGRPEHLVQLNGAGDSILATLPLLYGSPGLLRDIEPWIQNRYSGKSPLTLQLQAARYGWEDMGQ